MGNMNARIKSLFKNKWFVGGLVLVIGAAVIIGSILYFNQDNSLRIRELGKNVEVVRKVGDYKRSSMELHKNGTFEVSVIYYDSTIDDHVIEFRGIGMFEKRDGAYIFTYINIFRRVDVSGEPDGNGSTYPNGTWVYKQDLASLTRGTETNGDYRYEIVKGRIAFHCPNFRFYHFG